MFQLDVQKCKNIGRAILFMMKIGHKFATCPLFYNY